MSAETDNVGHAHAAETKKRFDAHGEIEKLGAELGDLRDWVASGHDAIACLHDRVEILEGHIGEVHRILGKISDAIGPTTYVSPRRKEP